MTSKLKWIGLAGPTASGKTAAALAIARQRPVEIISVDSALVYRSMDIGTAKPTNAERASVPHHLIDIRDPLQAYSAAEFAADATRLIADINARGKLALLVGGTMLYFKTLVDGIDPMPPADAALRAALDAEAADIGWPAMHAQLAAVDPLTAARLSPNDAQRIQRALEVHRSSGRPLSAFHTRAQRGAADAAGDVLLIALEPQHRSWLHAGIAERFERMLAAGLLDEVRALRARGDLHLGLASMRCVGYRQLWDGLDQAAEPWTPQQWQTVRDKGIAATRQLAKRQLTWLRSMPARRVVACDAPDALQQVLSLVQAAT